ncbi:MAG TPA: tRNA-binding protein [Thermoanaerobaculia bacterium]|nr:tRNA-binding protein [Thermoanaerobaculia bacterium]
MTPAPLKPTVPFSAVEALDVRVGTITAIHDVPGSAKLLRLIVDFGDHKRTILAGLKKERSNPQEIVGRQALFVVNLEPRRMAGEVSEGMLFDLGYADGILPALAVPERPVPNGTRAG